MFQELQPFLPKEIGTLSLALSILGSVIGAGLWLIGARYSRSLITLVLVSAGGWIGLFLPGWFGWNIQGWAMAIVAALVLGGGGYLLHRFWVGLGLGVVLAGWAAMIVWALCGDPNWVLPKYEVGVTSPAYAKLVWDSLPLAFQRTLPIATAAVALGGLLAAWIWPRVGVVLLYSAAGVSMLATAGLWLVRFARPHWAESLPATRSSQALLVAGMVALGATLQWNLALSKRGLKSKSEKPVVVVQ